MLIALLSDIHANLEALQACLKHAKEKGPDRYVFLGDLVGYGADPAAVVDIVADYASRGAVVIKGNHDEAIFRKGRDLNDVAFESLEWTRNALSDSQKNFLSALPLIVREEDFCFVHSSAENPEKWEYVMSSAAARASIEASGRIYTFAGHVHDQMLYFKTQTGKTAAFQPITASVVPVPSHRNWFGIVGTVGQPRDRNPAAGYALFDGEKEEMTFFRVAYDHLAAAQKIRRAGLSEVLAHRIEEGI